MHMIKKPVILLFAIFFLLSNTGLPLTLHFCKMQNTERKKCSSCTMQNKEGMKCSSCTMQNENTKQVQVKKTTGNCCKTEIIKSNIKDNYLSSKTSDDTKCVTSPVILSQQINFQNYLKNIQKKDASPPLLSPGNLYLFNSTLLI